MCWTLSDRAPITRRVLQFSTFALAGACCGLRLFVALKGQEKGNAPLTLSKESDRTRVDLAVHCGDICVCRVMASRRSSPALISARAELAPKYPYTLEVAVLGCIRAQLRTD